VRRRFDARHQAQLGDLPEAISGLGAPQRRTEPAAPTVRLGDAPRMAAHGDWTQQSFKDAKEAQLAVFEREYLAQMLARHAGNLSQAARQAEVDRKHFRRLARKYQLVAGKPDDDD